jgi:hypothetical protein
MGVSKVFVDESKVIRPLMVGSVSRKYSTSLDLLVLVETKIKKIFWKVDMKKVNQEFVGME